MKDKTAKTETRPAKRKGSGKAQENGAKHNTIHIPDAQETGANNNATTMKSGNTMPSANTAETANIVETPNVSAPGTAPRLSFPARKMAFGRERRSSCPVPTRTPQKRLHSPWRMSPRRAPMPTRTS